MDFTPGKVIRQDWLLSASPVVFVLPRRKVQILATVEVVVV